MNIDGLSGDIEVHLLQGEIMLHLSPRTANTTFAQRAISGNVNSDFSGMEKTQVVAAGPSRREREFRRAAQAQF